MDLKSFSSAVVISVLTAGCSSFRQPPSNADSPVNQSNQAVNNQPVKPDYNACALIPNEEIEKVQGEKVTEAKNSSRVSGSLIVSQCFYQLANYSKSVSLEITQSAKDGAEKTDLSEIWKKQFNGHIFEDNDRGEEEAEREAKKDDKEKSEKKSEHRESAESEKSGEPLEAVPNLGEAAFRAGNRITRALYVLDKNTIIRISLGGTDGEKAKAEKMTVLIQKVLPKI